MKEKSLEKKALVTGITGQDGSYLAELLINKGYEVYGLHRRTSMDVFDRIGNLRKEIKLVAGDVTDFGSIIRMIKEINPDEIYNLAAQSFVPDSWTQPISTVQINALGVINILEAIRILNPKIKFYQASTSEMFGKVKETPQNENTPFHPRSPYAASKAFSYYITQNYRESYNIFACNGILFNHESPKRGKQFVTRKITHSVAKIKLGYQDFFEIGNMDAKRDWGYAGDYVEAMWLMMQKEKSDNYVIGTGETHSVREFIEESFKVAGMPIKWEGKGIDEVGKYQDKVVVKVSPKFYRPAEVDLLLSDPSKAKKVLGWNPKVKFKELVKMMVESDLNNLSKYGMLESDKSRLDK
ncbi:MAG: dTDP-glucose 4,6-dehydratase [Candidatus Diapherotrites archaeon ADurb.Bin253]|jgi:GDPmannose 4,6-dehydratase|nr:MAG: dTDP-glucose 4,6-dehydratase [Candidatus Diapherotrites archaeon ADurb.Bin253]HNZ52382.1 GDP-mannose 4,6-dehydratase [Candidatus Pacearchaeota archaeon]HOF44564.1 GDP-mannose 4,6-dehydratase [Candidatus Pacearchaeota archaeon]HOR52749.1 GDP-mannose 4,6-dehydratase [Candidatus Pacearchaeota archaeon]HOU79212.1 GDP-mannose 4,6-dehydratase [Candidatus Pacearchaeota archaeon]